MKERGRLKLRIVTGLPDKLRVHDRHDLVDVDRAWWRKLSPIDRGIALVWAEVQAAAGQHVPIDEVDFNAAAATASHGVARWRVVAFFEERLTRLGAADNAVAGVLLGQGILP